MSAKKGFFVLLRIVFVFSFLQFMRDVFYKWDGYSYYMKFTDFLPDLSLTYIFIALYAVLFAILAWLGLYILYRIIPKSLNVRLEQLLFWFIICVLFLLGKKIFLKSVSLSKLFGLNYFVILVVGGILTGLIVWFLRRHTEKILNVLNDRITPLVWGFMILFFLAVPFSAIKGVIHHIKPELSGYTAVKKEQRTTISQAKRPNIILVVMDALTARDMQLYGYGRRTTPFISEWSKKSVVFKREYSSANWTTPAMMSMLTGQRPWTHKVWYRAYYRNVESYSENLPRLLKESGYAVYGFVQNHYAHPDVLGMGDAFTVKHKSHTFSLPPDSLSGKIRRYFINRPVAADWILSAQPIVNALIKHFRTPMSETLVPPKLVYDSFLNYISESRKRSEERNIPFFALLHVYPPHSWYLPPEPYQGIFGDRDRFNTDIKQKKFASREYPPEMQSQIDILRKRYDEFIVYSDRQFGIFMSRLAETMDMSNTIVILTSDHGESFSHGYQEHDGPYLYEEFVHVPLLIKLPGAQNGKIINTPVEQIDIAPTILELAGIPISGWMEGRSLVPLFKGRPFEPRPVFSMQLIKNRSFGHSISDGTVAVWDENYKLIYYLKNRKTLLFNLQTDPFESKNLSIDKPEVQERLLKLIQENLSIKNAAIVGKNN
jgi:arylsulfatase A-like enzyme